MQLLKQEKQIKLEKVTSLEGENRE